MLSMVRYILQNDSIFQEIMVSMVILKVNANVDDTLCRRCSVKANIKGGL